jgi:DNA-binding XRE family transcriptional regulator
MTKAHPKTADTKFVRGNERITRMSKDPDLAPRVQAVRESMDEADRIYVRGLTELRRAANQTQVELAATLGITQGAVSKLEGRDDLLLSTLNSYVEALGGHARIIVDFEDGQSASIALDALTGEPA